MDKIVSHDDCDAGETDGSARTLGGVNRHGDCRFAFEQAAPRLGQVLDRRPLARANHGMTGHKIHTFVNVLGLHGAMAQLHKCSRKGVNAVLLGP